MSVFDDDTHITHSVIVYIFAVQLGFYEYVKKRVKDNSAGTNLFSSIAESSSPNKIIPVSSSNQLVVRSLSISE